VLPYLLALPWLSCLLAAWLAAGLLVARGCLRLRDGVDVATLALPLGLISHLLATNVVGRLVFLPTVLRGAVLLSLVAGAVAWRRRRTPLTWTFERKLRIRLLALGIALALAGMWLQGREYFGDDAGHASMTHLLAAGQFPLRFQCNPALRAAYAYGGNLLAAQVMVTTGLGAFEAVDVVKAAVVSSVTMLAFLTGWRPRRRVGSGLLAVLLLFTAGPMVWLLLPLADSGHAQRAAFDAGLAPLVEAAGQLGRSPWDYAVVTPGFITTQFAHAQRALAWGFAPFMVLLFLALLEVPLTRRRRTLALSVVLSATALTQPGALILLASACAGYAAWRLRRRSAAGSLDLDFVWVLVLAGLLAALQGGPITDSLLDRLDGRINPTTSFHFDPLRWPSCRSSPADLSCAVLSALNLGLVPFLLPWLALALWHGGPRVRLALVVGCATAYAFPFFFRYDYLDWNVQRVLTYASWTVAVLLAPLLFEQLTAGGARRALALALLLTAGWGGLVQLGVVIDGRWGQDHFSTLEHWHLGPLDDELARLEPLLPRNALIFDAEACMVGTACRPAIVFGRYGASASDRGDFRESITAAFRQIRADPRARALRDAGYTHVYLDANWLAGLGDTRARFQGGPFELLGLAGDRDDFRALLRVCAPREKCSLSLPGIL
jgi:hypothetical protein